MAKVRCYSAAPPRLRIDPAAGRALILSECYARRQRTYRQVIMTMRHLGLSLADPTRSWPPELLQSIGRDLVGLAEAAREHLLAGNAAH
jgi:hypothetical protein